jgi:hypothetical protein
VAEIKDFTRVPAKMLGFVLTSGYVETVFSVARSVTADHQMAMKQEIISARVIVQANRSITKPMLTKVLALGRAGWNQVYCELEQRKLSQHTAQIEAPWFLVRKGPKGSFGTHGMSESRGGDRRAMGSGSERESGSD